MAEPNGVRKLAAKVAAHYEILSAGLSAVRREMTEGFAESRESYGELQSHTKLLQDDVKSVQGDMKSMQDDMKSMQDDMNSMQEDLTSMHGHLDTMQGSLARLARQQDAHAERVDTVLGETLEKSQEASDDLNDAFGVLTRQYDVVEEGLNDIDDLKARLSAVEEDLTRIKKKIDDAA